MQLGRRAISGSRQVLLAAYLVVVASAEFDEALVLADRVVCMRKGQIAAEGPTSGFDEHALTELAGAMGDPAAASAGT